MELKNNQGLAFSNDKAKDTQPDFKGELNIEGKVWQVALWKAIAKNGKPYLSIKVEVKGVAEDKPRESVSSAPVLNDDIPFD